MAKWLVETDFAYNDPLQVVLKRIRNFDGLIRDFDPEGPGGGNPCLVLSFHTKEDAEAFAKDHSPDDPPKVRKVRS